MKFSSLFLRTALVPALALGMGSLAPVFAAGSATGTMNVTATVVASCTFGSSTTLAFPTNIGSLNSAVSESSAGALSVTCNNGSPWSIVYASDTNGSAGQAKLKNVSTADTMNYALYSDAAHTTAFVTSGTSLGQTGTGLAQTQAVYGQIAAGQTLPPAGSYADVATFTVNY